MPLKGMIGNARIVALGEATHAHMSSFNETADAGISGRRNGFNTFAMEANWPKPI